MTCTGLFFIIEIPSLLYQNTISRTKYYFLPYSLDVFVTILVYRNVDYLPNVDRIPLALDCLMQRPIQQSVRNDHRLQKTKISGYADTNFHSRTYIVTPIHAMSKENSFVPSSGRSGKNYLIPFDLNPHRLPGSI